MFIGNAGYEELEASDADKVIGILESRIDLDLVLTEIEMWAAMDKNKLSHYIRDMRPPVRLIVASGIVILEESILPDRSRFFPIRCNSHGITDAMPCVLPNHDRFSTDRYG